MENTNESPDPQDDSLDSEAADPDGLLAAAAAIKEGPTEYMTNDDFTSEQPYTAPSGYGGATPPPAPASTLVESRLTRDPFATLGGVLSGIAHRYGWDVSLTRIAFVVIFLMSGGTAVLAYLLAWMIIPRAQFWPPVQRHTPQISGRDLGIGLLGLAGIITLGIGSGRFAGVIVPLALVGGGVWLLSQNPRAENSPALAGAGGSVGGGPLPPADFSRPPTPPPFEPQPVPTRSRKSRGLLAVGILTVLAVPVLAVGGIIAVVAIASDDADFDFDGSDSTTYGFTTVGEIPTSISEENGELIIDLADVDFSSIEGEGDRVDLDVNLDFGKLEVILPEDVRVEIDAEVDAVGQVSMFGREDSGISPDITVDDENAQLFLDLEVGVGEVQVTRVGS